MPIFRPKPFGHGSSVNFMNRVRLAERDISRIQNTNGTDVWNAAASIHEFFSVLISSRVLENRILGVSRLFRDAQTQGAYSSRAVSNWADYIGESGDIDFVDLKRSQIYPSIIHVIRNGNNQVLFTFHENFLPVFLWAFKDDLRIFHTLETSSELVESLTFVNSLAFETTNLVLSHDISTRRQDLTMQMVKIDLECASWVENNCPVIETVSGTNSNVCNSQCNTVIESLHYFLASLGRSTDDLDDPALLEVGEIVNHLSNFRIGSSEYHDFISTHLRLFFNMASWEIYLRQIERINRISSANRSSRLQSWNRLDEIPYRGDLENDVAFNVRSMGMWGDQNASGATFRPSTRVNRGM